LRQIPAFSLTNCNDRSRVHAAVISLVEEFSIEALTDGGCHGVLVKAKSVFTAAEFQPLRLRLPACHRQFRCQKKLGNTERDLTSVIL
jgi:hypothetical protein